MRYGKYQIFVLNMFYDLRYVNFLFDGHLLFFKTCICLLFHVLDAIKITDAGKNFLDRYFLKGCFL